MGLRDAFRRYRADREGAMNADFTVNDAGEAAPDLDTTKFGLHDLGGWMKAHPWQTAGYGLTGAMNIGGLFDNDKLLGQLGGAGIGYGITKIPAVSGLLAAHGINPALVAMGGGALGSLFDKLRAKRDV